MLSPPHDCPFLPITVLLLPTLSPSFPSLSHPSHHCPPPPHTVTLLPITVPSSPSLSPPVYSTVPYCPLLPITVSSFPSPSHHVIMAGCFPPEYSSSPQSGQLKELLLSVSEVYIPRWSASCSGSRLSGDYLVWARDLDEQCGMYCQPLSR